MVWEQESHVLVMLTTIVERGKVLEPNGSHIYVGQEDLMSSNFYTLNMSQNDTNTPK